MSHDTRNECLWSFLRSLGFLRGQNLISRLLTEFAQCRLARQKCWPPLKFMRLWSRAATHLIRGSNFITPVAKTCKLATTYGGSTNPPISVTALAAKRDISSRRVKLPASQDIVVEAGRQESGRVRRFHTSHLTSCIANRVRSISLSRHLQT